MPINFTGRPCAWCPHVFDELSVAVYRILVTPNGGKVGVLFHPACARAWSEELQELAAEAEAGERLRRGRSLGDSAGILPIIDVDPSN